MLRRLQSRRFAVVFTLVLALAIAFFVHGSLAGSVYLLHGSASDFCDRTGQSAPAGYQGGYFGSELHGFWDQENVTITFSFPDGRIFTPESAQQLDGVVNMPPNYTQGFQTDVAGDLYFDYQITNKWPYGCYQMTAQGNNSGQVAIGFFVVKRPGAPASNQGPAKLAVWRNGTFEAEAIHDSLVNIHGVGFLPNEQVGISITQPDGTVIGYPNQVASDAGNFESTFLFTSAHQTGMYTFTASGLASGYQVFAPFELKSGTSVPSGWAQVHVVYPASAATTQNGSDIVVSGTLFSPGEPVGIWLTLPDGSVRGLPTQLADGNGDFYATLAIDERLPLGNYHLTAKGVDSGRLVITEFDVDGGTFQGVPVGQPDPPAPLVDVSNTGEGTLGGPTNIVNAGNNAGPQITPQDRQNCSDPTQLWAPNC